MLLANKVAGVLLSSKRISFRCVYNHKLFKSYLEVEHIQPDGQACARLYVKYSRTWQPLVFTVELRPHYKPI